MTGKIHTFVTARNVFLDILLGLWTTVIAALCAVSIQAAAGPWDQNEEARVRLVSTTQTVGREQQLLLGLEFELNPNWKIYWRSPGDAGTPPVLDWAEGSNVANSQILWPVPKRFSLFGIETFGYGDHVILPVQADLVTPGQGSELAVQVDYLICAEICIPDRANLTLSLGQGPLSPSAVAADITGYQAQVPGWGAERGLQLASFQLEQGADGPSAVIATLLSDAPLVDPDLLVEGPEGFSFGPPEVAFSDGDLRATLRSPIDIVYNSGEVITADNLTLTATDHTPGGVRGVESPAALVRASFNNPPTAVATLAAGPALWLILLFALLGGFILNLMPCVLPVLSLKLLSFVGKGGAERSEIQRSFFATGLGIIVSFLLIALVLIALKSTGAAIGWGIQFQQPLFILALIAIIALFTANLFGGFEIQLPQSVNQIAGSAGSSSKGLVGDFATGAFATLLATPCSAPFLGTAISFALVQSPPTVLLVFFVLGLGMALPYLAVILFPGLAQRMPRPGMWMVWLRRALGLLLVATIVWLLTVLLAQVGLVATLVAGGAAALLLSGLTLKGRVWKVGALAAAAALFIAPVALKSNVQTVAPSDSRWIAFDESSIPARVAAGEVIFVDVTADWCITCKVNKKVVFGNAGVKALLDSGAIIAMQADWTRPDPAIAAYLEKHGRTGIPFNMVYGPATPAGQALPELLTPGVVLAAIDAAAGTLTSSAVSN